MGTIIADDGAGGNTPAKSGRGRATIAAGLDRLRKAEMARALDAQERGDDFTTAASAALTRQRQISAISGEILIEPIRFDDDAHLPTFDDRTLVPLEAIAPDFVAMLRWVARERQVPIELPMLFGLGTAAAVAAGLEPQAPEADTRPGHWHRGVWVHYVGRRWMTPVNLYAMAVIGSGGGKSPAADAMTKPLHDLQLSERQRMTDAVHAAQVHVALLERKITEAQSRAAKGTGGEDAERTYYSLSQDLQRYKATMPVMPRRIFGGDDTPEALTIALAEQGRIAVLSAEGKILEAGTMYQAQRGAANVDVLILAWKGEDIIQSRVGRPDISIRDALMTIAIGTQPGRLEQFAANRSHSDLGLLQRFLILMPTKAHVGYRNTRPGVTPAAVQRAYHDLILRLDAVHGTIKVHDGTAAGDVLHAAEQAEETRRRPGELYATYGDLAMSWAEKADNQLHRLFGLFTALGAAQAGIRNVEDVPAATVEHAAQAAVAAMDVFRAHTLAAHVKTRTPGAVPEAAGLLDDIRKLNRSGRPDSEPSSWTKRALHNQVRGRYPTAAMIDPLLAILEERHLIIPLDGDAGLDRRGAGRPSRRFATHPRAFEPAQPQDVTPIADGAVYQGDQQAEAQRFQVRPCTDKRGYSEILDTQTGTTITVPNRRINSTIERLEQQAEGDA